MHLYFVVGLQAAAGATSTINIINLRTRCRTLPCHASLRSFSGFASVAPVRMSAKTRQIALTGLLKATVSVAAGAALGSVTHQVVLQWVAQPSHSLMDVLLNFADVGAGLVLGVAFGLLWILESVFIRSGVITATLKGAASGLKDNDEAAGARIAEAVRALKGVQGWLVRTTLEFSGVSVEKAFERAEAEKLVGKRAGMTASELFGLIFEETLAARAFEIRVTLAGVSIAIFTGVTAFIFAFDAALTQLGA
mmetsp:Transcript_42991/g.71434  ORF Transcript_42991/g.71434 Transcript_42991/m.71434 type:complete len:251 (+) Transcript_42991:90-842(+)|eukprot:CAMPEP_0119326674 /NCGR_PEP_ID=MMETSP1333-20130426/68999_1 /TAXON_ID=418940 /ORGANISM="Scyphosphaera apsteinii, Strain RCC1455" /LENGTH=250 /DNA_ID=CAMNT_0007335041 /DNA_START=87 /DNA_END=839 /DNA_ORIENTATION=+